MPKQRPEPRRSDAERRLRQADRFARVLRLLQLIMGRGRWNAKSLAREQECSERTVYRDLNVLELAGVPWYFDEEYGYYSVRPDFHFPVLNLTGDELLGQAAATAVADAVGLKIGTGAKPTTQKLAAASKDEVRRFLDDAARVVAVLDLKLADHGQHQEIVRTIQWALVRRKLAGQYRSPYADTLVKVVLNPYRLCLVKQAWYLIAQPVGGSEARTYRVARFKALRMLSTPASVPEAFDLKAYFGNAWGVYRGDKTYDVKVTFTKDAAPLVTETTWHPTQQAHHRKDGSVTLCFRVDGLTEILWWVLGWAGRAKVVAPPELQDMVIEQLQAALKLNARETDE